MKKNIRIVNTLYCAKLLFSYIWQNARLFGALTVLCSLLVSLGDILSITLLASFLDEEFIILNKISFLSWINNANFLNIILVLIISLILRLILQSSIDLTSAKVSSGIAKELYYSYFTKDYLSLKKFNKSKFITLATSYINSTAASSIDVLNVIAYSFNVILTLTIIILIGGLITFYVLGTTLFIYILYIFCTKKYISRFSKKAAEYALQAGYQCINDVNTFKKIILEGDQYNKSITFSRIVFQERFFIQFTRFLANSLKPTIETFFLIIIIIATSIDKNSGNFGAIVSICYGIIRALPGINTVYSSYIGLKAGYPKLIELFKIINDREKIYSKSNIGYKNIANFNSCLDNIILDNIEYSYISKSNLTKNYNLKVNLKFEKGNNYLLIGESGSGKSTLIDILMGLIKPSKGRILFNKKNVFKNHNFINFYRKNFSHISQDNFIIEKNIDSFLNYSYLNNEQRKLVRNLAIEFNLITSHDNLKNWLLKDLGENASTLSVGQRQRLNIIKILLEEKPIIIFDEATSAIDSSMEKKVINKIFEYASKKLIILITHRPENIDYTKINKVIKIESSFKNNNEMEAVEIKAYY